MKIIVIGDIHGRDIWKEIVKQEYDKVIFLGDYLDSYDLPVDKQRQNLIDILEFKANNRDKVELLIGNHDFQYLPGINETYSGYNGFEMKLVDGSIIKEEEISPNILNPIYSQVQIFTEQNLKIKDKNHNPPYNKV